MVVTLGRVTNVALAVAKTLHLVKSVSAAWWGLYWQCCRKCYARFGTYYLVWSWDRAHLLSLRFANRNCWLGGLWRRGKLHRSWNTGFQKRYRIYTFQNYYWLQRLLAHNILNVTRRPRTRTFGHCCDRHCHWPITICQDNKLRCWDRVWRHFRARNDSTW